MAVSCARAFNSSIDVSFPKSSSLTNSHVSNGSLSNHSESSSLASPSSLSPSGGLPPLGSTYTNLSTPPTTVLGQTTEKGSEIWRLDRHLKHRFLQKAARRFLDLHDSQNTYHRFNACLSLMRKESISLRVSNETGQPYISGLCVCGYRWPCPICVFKISNGRRDLLSKALKLWTASGGVAYMVTYTLRHHSSDDFSSLHGGMREAHKKFKSGNPWKKIAAKHGIKGTAHSVEVTYSDDNGYHPHIHELYFCDKDSLERDYPRLLKRWKKKVREEGLKSVNEHGLRVDTVFNEEDISIYIMKHGGQYDIAFEMTGRDYKKARKKEGASLAQLLTDYAMEEDLRSGLIWMKIVTSLKSKPSWNFRSCARLFPGLKEESAYELASKELTRNFTFIMDLVWEQWREIQRKDLYPGLLRIARSRDFEQVADFLRSHDVPIGRLDTDDLFWDNLDTANKKYYRPGYVPNTESFRAHLRELAMEARDMDYARDERLALQTV